MRIRRAAVRTGWFLSTAVIAMVEILLRGRSGSQTSQIKKPLIYQVGNVVRINAEGPRPLLRALDALQDKYGWIVDYEDPQYPADSDLGANAQPLPRRRHPNVRNQEGNFTVEFNSGPSPDSIPDENSVLKIVVDAYNQGNADKQFELRKEQEGRFDVVGAGVRDQRDEVIGGQPVLDLLITLEAKRRSADETFSIICQKVSQQSKIPVTPIGVADDIRGHKTVVVGGAGLSARTLLSRTLAIFGDHLSWRLLYDANGKSYELSLARSSHEQ
jgi:hypothetical protein